MKTKRIFGIDISKRKFNVCLLNLDGSKEQRCFLFSQIESFKKLLRKDDIVAYEVSSQSFWFYDQLETYVNEQLVLNPYALAVIYKSMKKTDKSDALKLALLVKGLNEELLPQVKVPNEDIRILRTCLKERSLYIKQRTMIKNSIHALFSSKGILDLTSSDVNNIPKINEKKSELPKEYQKTLERHLVQLETSNNLINQIDEDFNNEVKSIKYSELLLSIPGISALGCVVIYSMIQNIEYFSTKEQFCAYAGLTPKVDSSGNTVHYGRISKKGPPILRHILVQTVWVMVRMKLDNSITKHYLDVKKRRGTGRACVAAARKLAVTIWCMLKRGELFRGLKEDLYEKKLKAFNINNKS